MYLIGTLEGEDQMQTTTRDDQRIARELWWATLNGCVGFTVDTHNEPLPRNGYFVGGQSYTLVRAANMITPDEITRYVTSHPETRFFGMWVEGSDVYVDCVDHVTDAETAHQMGQDREEIAIYNIATGECERS